MTIELLTSVKGILVALNWPGTNSAKLTHIALEKLMAQYDCHGNKVVDVFWHEIAGDHLLEIEALAEDTQSEYWRLASLVASKVHFHLGSYEDAKIYALGAEDLFDTKDNSAYATNIIAACIDSYKELRSSGESDTSQLTQREMQTHRRQEEVVNSMFEKCLNEGQFKHCMGLAIETKRVDMFSRSIDEAQDRKGMFSYAFQTVMKFIENRTYRHQLIRKLYDVCKGDYSENDKNNKTLSEWEVIPEWVQMVQCLILLGDPTTVGDVLDHLITPNPGRPDNVPMAFQIAFDIYESATQQFVNRVIKLLKTAESNVTSDGISETDTKILNIQKLTAILSGSETILLHMQFLSKNDMADKVILKQTKDAIRDTISHTTTITANGFMHCGTTHDYFLRDNIDWLARSTNWAKFSAIASLGAIHHGHEKDSRKLMQAYLPKGEDGFGYAEGGGLYALGLIHANHGENIIDYLIDQISTETATTEALKHGGCLGLGVAAMGTQRADIYELLKNNLYSDDAVVGEAAGIAIGLVELGSGNSTALSDMVAYASDTQHEKIIRGIAIGLALVMYGRLEEADPLIETLCKGKDSVLRRSGMYTIAMAYCGTGSNKAIRKLLHVAVSDVNDDVRRAAVTSLGFLLFKTPEKCPGVVSLLSESYNPGVRYGSAMALGIACAGTGNKEALALIEPMVLNDTVSLVRQGALIASALILIRHNEATCSKVKDFRALYSKIIADKHEGQMVKLGAILAQGIIDAGGRNMTVNLQSRTGHNNISAVVGMLVFIQYWYWFPLAHFLCISFTPSCLIALDDKNKSDVTFTANANPSDYAYPPPIQVKKKEDKTRVATAILSTTARHKKKDTDKAEKKDDEGEEPSPPEPFEYSE